MVGINLLRHDINDVKIAIAHVVAFHATNLFDDGLASTLIQSLRVDVFVRDCNVRDMTDGDLQKAGILR